MFTQDHLDLLTKMFAQVGLAPQFRIEDESIVLSNGLLIFETELLGLFLMAVEFTFIKFSCTLKQRGERKFNCTLEKT